MTVMSRPVFAHCNIGARRLALSGLLLALLCACEQADLPAPGPVPPDLKARQIEQIQNLHLTSGECAAVLGRSLHGHGFRIAGQTAADASLRLQLRNKRPLRQHLPVIQSLGWQAYFRADIIGAEQKLLLSFFGQEGSLSFRELCDDIGDEIAYKLKEYMPARD